MRPNISVLIPSRGRPAELDETLRLLLKNCKRKQEIEVLVRVDEDDAETQSMMGKWKNLKVFVGEQVGYENLHILYNDLAKEACGKWLFLLADDAKVETSGWDRLITGIKDRICVIKFEDCWRPGPQFPCFPIVPRTVYEVLGHLSLNPNCGLWLDEVVRQRAGFALKYFERATIQHCKPRLGLDSAAKELLNETFVDFYSLESEEQRNQDAKKLLDFYSKQPVVEPKSELVERKLDAISRRWLLSSINR